VAAQSVPPALWVVVDGSTDETPAILEEYARRLRRLLQGDRRLRAAGDVGQHRLPPACMLGWIAESVDLHPLRFVHLHPHCASQKGIWTGRVRVGFGQYFMGTSSLYLSHQHTCLLPAKAGRHGPGQR
jgi:glycosyltransferase involved in cell wall biosynthesis